MQIILEHFYFINIEGIKIYIKKHIFILVHFFRFSSSLF